MTHMYTQSAEHEKQARDLSKLETILYVSVGIACIAIGWARKLMKGK